MEITERCNSSCAFCHQDFGQHRGGHGVDTSLGLYWIRWAADQGIRFIRFTGGEPTLHPGLEHFCRVAWDHGLKIIINTNGLASFSILKRISRWVHTLKVSLPSPHGKISDSTTGSRNSLRRKLDTMALALESAIQVEALTAMIPQNVGIVTDFLELLANFPGVTWVPLRIESSAKNPRPITRNQMQRLAEEFDALRNRFLGVPKLRLATPFCSVEPPELGARVFSGRVQDCGPFKSLTVNVDGRLMSCYSCRTPIQRAASLDAVFTDPEVIRLTCKKSLPVWCQQCGFADQCMGGCASPYAAEVRDGELVDYLSRPMEG